MQYKIKILIISFALLTSNIVFSQNDIDALRYSQQYYGGTARSAGIGNAVGALGADFSALTINPAGIAQYRSSSFMFSPELAMQQNTSEFVGNTNRDYKYNFNFNNIGLVLANTNQSGNWQTLNFAIGYNRLNNFHNRYFFSGYNPDNSILDRFTEDANANGGTAPEIFYDSHPFGAGLAWETFLLNQADTGAAWNEYQQFFPLVEDGGVTQQRTVTERGAIDESFISLGANYDDRFLFGATLGIPSIRYRRKSIYTEKDEEDNYSAFNDLLLEENLSANGTGVNLKIGGIYKPTNWLRAGVAFHTPTAYSITETFSSIMSSNLVSNQGSNDFWEQSSPDGEFKYYLFTPWRVSSSLALVFRNIGFISADYEFTDYGSPRFVFRTTDVNEKLVATSINQTISDKYGGTHHLRLGAETRVDNFRMRAGYAFYGTPFRNMNGIGNLQQRDNYSLGFGYIDEEVFFDLAYTYSQSTTYDLPYELDDSSEPLYGVDQKIGKNSLLFTFGVLF